MKTKSSSTWTWFSYGALAGLTTLSIALGAGAPMHVTDDTAIYQNLSEIRVQKQADLNFDSDIAHLSAMEGRYHESLPSLAEHPRLRAPIKRISQQKYHFSGRRQLPVARD